MIIKQKPGCDMKKSVIILLTYVTTMVSVAWGTCDFKEIGSFLPAEKIDEECLPCNKNSDTVLIKTDQPPPKAECLPKVVAAPKPMVEKPQQPKTPEPIKEDKPSVKLPSVSPAPVAQVKKVENEPVKAAVVVVEKITVQPQPKPIEKNDIREKPAPVVVDKKIVIEQPAPIKVVATQQIEKKPLKSLSIPYNHNTNIKADCCPVYTPVDDEECVPYHDYSPCWAFPVAFYVSSVDKSFDNCGNSKSFSNLLFQGDLRIQDIYLFSKLSAQNKVRIDNVPAREPQRPIQVNNVPFGGYASDLYTTLLAPTRILFDTTQQEVGASITAMRQLCTWCNDSISLIAGITIPIISRRYSMDFYLVDGHLFEEVFIPDQTNRENTLKPFFRDWISVDDFFIRGVLGSKGFTFNNRVRKTGVGDISLFGLLDWACPYIGMRDAQLGLHLTVPSGGKQDVCQLLPSSLGNGGSVLLSASLHVAFATPCATYFNPVARLIGEFSMPFSSCRRVGTGKVQPQGAARTMAENIPGLSVPPSYTEFWVDAFSDVDTVSPAFADTVTSVRTRWGHRVLAMIGNYFHNPMGLNCMLGIFYEFMYKSKDHVSLPKKCSGSSVIDTNSLVRLSRARYHQISWDIAYLCEGGLELTLGSRHVVAGKNTPKLQQFFITGLFRF